MNNNGSEKNHELNTFDNVYNELKTYMREKNIQEFRCKGVSKLYAFERKDIPNSGTYLEVRYSASYPSMDPNYSGPAIQAVFETSTNALELFLIEKNIKGPCWLDVKISSSDPTKFSVQNAFSWCDIEVKFVVFH